MFQYVIFPAPHIPFLGSYLQSSHHWLFFMIRSGGLGPDFLLLIESSNGSKRMISKDS